MFSPAIKNKFPPVWLWIILVTAVVIRIALGAPWCVPPDIYNCYYPTVKNILSGDFSINYWWDYRFVLLFSLAQVSELTSSNIAGMAGLGILCSVIQTAMVYFIGRLLFSERAALLAALFDVVVPLGVFFGGYALPDTMMTSLLAVAMYLCIRGSLEKYPLFYVLSGLCIGLAYGCKITALFFVPLPVICILLWDSRFFVKSLLWGMLGFLLYFSLETFIVSAEFGHLTTRFHGLLSSSTSQLADMPEGRYFPGFFKNAFVPFSIQGRWFALFGAGSLVASIYLLVKKKKEQGVILIICWFWILLLLSNFAGTSLEHPVIATLRSRYLGYIVPPMCLLCACLVDAIKRKLFVYGLSALMVISGVAAGLINYSTFKVHNDSIAYICNYLKTRPIQTEPLYTYSKNQKNLLNFAVRYDAVDIITPDALKVTSGSGRLYFKPYYIDYQPLDSGYKNPMPRKYIDDLISSDWKVFREKQFESGCLGKLLEKYKLPNQKGWYVDIKIYEKLKKTE